MQCLVENAKKVIEVTKSIPRNQWHQQILAQADQPPTSQKFWNQSPVKQNDWAIEYRR